MNPEIIISVLALFVAAVAAVASIAGLTDEGRARLAGWTKTAASKTYRIGYVLFLLVSLINGIAGVVLFGLEPTPPSRKDILFLLMFLINIGIGAYGFYRMPDRYVTAKNQETEAQEPGKDAAPV